MAFLEGVGRRQRIEGGEFGSMIQLGLRSLNGRERNLLLKNLSGPGGDRELAFADVAYVGGADRLEDGRGVVAFDLEGDGDLDLAIQNFQAPTRLLVNQGTPQASWLELRLQGTRSNRDAIGARVTVEAEGRRWVREVSGTAGYLSGASLMLHFGLGAAQRIERLSVHWPSGETTLLRDLPINQRLRIVEAPVDSWR